MAAGVAGNLIGSWIAYGVGRYKGREWALRWRWLHITPKRLDAADRWFARYGYWAVPVSRCLPIIRTFISLPAGIARMPFWRFTLLTVVGCLPWVLAAGPGRAGGRRQLGGPAAQPALLRLRPRAGDRRGRGLAGDPRPAPARRAARGGLGSSPNEPPSPVDAAPGRPSRRHDPGFSASARSRVNIGGLARESASLPPSASASERARARPMPCPPFVPPGPPLEQRAGHLGQALALIGHVDGDGPRRAPAGRHRHGPGAMLVGIGQEHREHLVRDVGRDIRAQARDGRGDLQGPARQGEGAAPWLAHQIEETVNGRGANGVGRVAGHREQRVDRLLQAVDLASADASSGRARRASSSASSSIRSAASGVRS